MKKIEVIDTLKEMPDEFSADELIERILLLQKIDAGLNQVQTGKIYSEEEAEKRLEKWLK
jgi:aryl-alcohol dehydrogenase-like predicted oxidoreductase